MRTSATGRAVRGFTLLELLIALSISGMILVAVYGAFAAANRATRTLDASESRRLNLSYACRMLQRDLRSAVPPPAGEEGDNLWGVTECRFKSLAGDGTKGVVCYRLAEGKLERLYKPAAQGGKAAAPERKDAVAGGVTKVAFNYFTEGNWKDSLRPKQWPAAVAAELTFGEGAEASTFRQVVRLEVR